MPLFTELDFRMSVVKRWSVVETIRKQSLAEHTFNVLIIARKLAVKVLGAQGAQDLSEHITKRALYHDYDESVTGDFPSYMKPHVFVEPALQNVPAYYNDDAIDLGDVPDIVRFIVKAADYIDACIFLRMEISLGNRSVTYHLRHLEARFRQYLMEARVLDVAVGNGVYSLYQTEVVDKLFGGNGQYVSEIDGFPKK